MIPTYMSSSSSPHFPFDLNYSSGDQFHDDDDDHQNPNLNYFSSNYQASSSSNNNHNTHSSSSSHLFLNPTRDQHQLYHAQIYQQPHAQNANDNCGSYDMEGNKGKAESGHNNKLSLLWRKEEKYEGEKNNQEKVMPPAEKMKLVKKVVKKNSSSDRANMEVTNVKKLEDHQKGPLLSSSSLETDHSSNNSSYSNNGGNNNAPIVRVCTDCNTTKTPLWRSGPNGPKSLCNACGIRQRKARRAMAAAATAGTTPSSSPTTLKLKVQKTAAKSNYPFKKRCKFITEATAEAPSRDQEKKKHAVEDFLKNLSNNLVLHHGVFPQDEKDAAILLMAISCGLVHG